MKTAKWFCLLLAAGLSGCAGYHTGPTNGQAAGARSVRVDYFENQTLEPQLVVAVNRALKKRLQQDGTYTLQSHDKADLIVTGEITEFLRSGISYQPGDVLTVQDYSLQITANLKVTERATGKAILEQEVTGNTVVRVGNDFTAGQRRAVPLIADHLARLATDLIVDGPWPVPPAEGP